MTMLGWMWSPAMRESAWRGRQMTNARVCNCRIGRVWIKEPRANPFAKYAWSLRLLTDAEKGALR